MLDYIEQKKTEVDGEALIEFFEFSFNVDVMEKV